MAVGCGETHCPAFPDYLADYYPYQKGDTLLFVNQNHDTISFTVIEASSSKEYFQKYCAKCMCNPPTFLFRASLTNQCTHMQGVIYAGHKASMSTSRIEFDLGNCYFDATTFTSSSLILDIGREKDPFDSKNNALFGETVVLKNLENTDKQISRVVIVKGKGIVEFYDQKYNFLWECIRK